MPLGSSGWIFLNLRTAGKLVPFKQTSTLPLQRVYSLQTSSSSVSAVVSPLLTARHISLRYVTHVFALHQDSSISHQEFFIKDMCIHVQNFKKGL